MHEMKCWLLYNSGNIIGPLFKCIKNVPVGKTIFLEEELFQLSVWKGWGGVVLGLLSSGCVFLVSKLMRNGPLFRTNDWTTTTWYTLMETTKMWICTKWIFEYPKGNIMRLLFKLHQKCTSRKDNYFLLLQKSYFIYCLKQALFFNTCCAKKLKLKDKTQAKNSRKKLILSEGRPSNLRKSRK